MNVEQIFLILRARYLVVVVAILTTVASATFVSLLLAPKYRATAALVVDVKYADPIAGSILPALTAPSYMATQLDIIQSERVASAVVKSLKLDENPVAIERWKEATDSRGTIVSWLAGGLQGGLEVIPAKDSNVIQISYKDRDPAQAALIANTFATVYVETSLALRVEPARQYFAYFEEQGRIARERLEKAQKALSAFQQEHGLLAVSDDRLDVELSRLNELSSQLSSVQQQRSESRSREVEARTNAASSSEVLQNSLVNTLKSQLATQRASLQEMRATLGENHPQVARAREQVNALTGQLSMATSSIVNGIGTSDRVNVQREDDVRTSLAEQKARVLKLKADKDAASVLQREVDQTQRAFDAVSQRQTQSSLESQTTQTNIAVLSAAVVPARPYSPRVPLIIAASLAVGLLLGLGLVFLLEWKDRRIRSTNDLAGIFGLPVLGVVVMHQASLRRPRIGGSWVRGGHMPALPGSSSTTRL